MQMKLAITTDCFLPRWDGVARFLSLLLPEIASEMQVTILAPQFEGPVPAIDGIRLIRFPLIKIRLGDTFYCYPDRTVLAQTIGESEVVFNQTVGPISRLAIATARRLRKPVVSYVHSVEWELAHFGVRYGKWFASAFVRRWIRPVYEGSCLLLVPSDEVGALLARNRFRTRTQLAPIGVPTARFAPPASKATAKTTIGIDPNRRVIGFCGRLSREKDLLTLYKAFERIHEEYPDTLLLLVGDGSREKEIPSGPHVVGVGRQDEVVPYLQAMDVFVLPSLSETSSLATMEAMSVGLPVVATPVGAIAEYITHARNGLLFTPRDVPQLVESIEYLLNHPPVRETLGAAARRTIIERYSWEEAADRIKQILMTFSR